jgi:CRISPR-associated protein Csm4
MHTYRIALELRSGLGTPLAADTLWGHLAWGIRYREGPRALESWLDRYDRGDPPLVLSEPLPAGHFPRPALPPTPRPSEPPTPAQADDRKRLDKRAWINWAAWQAISREVSPASIAAAVAQTPAPLLPVEMAVTRAGINRLTGGTAQPEGGALFTVAQHYFDFSRPPRFDVWCLSPEAPAVVQQWFADGLSGGYGRDASAGLGKLSVEAVEAARLPRPEDANACVLLAPAVPRPGDPYRGFFNCGVRCGRLGGEFAIGGLPDAAIGRHKRPVRCLLAGTVLLAEAGVPECLGRVLRGVHPEIEAIRHYGMAPVLACRLSADLLNHPLAAGRSAAVGAPTRSVSEGLQP